VQNTGVIARGIVTPIFRQGDDIVGQICDRIIDTAQTEGFVLNDRDIVGVTEAVVGITQGNYASREQISKDFYAKFGGGTVGLVFPILSRNRFAVLSGIADACDKVVIQLSYPCDELGNTLVDMSICDEKGVNPYSDSFTEAEFREIFGMNTVHGFTGVDYIEYYKSIAPNCEIVFSNNPRHILNYTKKVLCCDVHTRFRTQKQIQEAGANICLRLDNLMTESIDGSGYSEYGLLGSNRATDDTLKLFPRDGHEFVLNLQAALKRKTGKTLEVMIFGDGAFKDPVYGIWELADPVISPAFTDGLSGTPNEVKIKYIADNALKGLEGDALHKALRDRIKNKPENLVGAMESQGTTPRRIHDLVGSLCDLISGSGDRGTPVVLVQNYFKNYADV